MGKATYVLAKDDISDIVNTGQELMDKFRHGLPKDTEIYGSDHRNLNGLEIPMVIRLENPSPFKNLPKTKVNGLYRLVKRASR